MFKKLLSLAFAFAAAAPAWAQVQQNTPTPNDAFEWTVGGQAAGFGLNWKAGDVRALIVEDGNKRRFGALQPATVTVQLGRLVPNGVQEWLRAALDGEQPTRDVELLELGPDKHTVAHTTRYTGSRITEITFPPLNVNDRRPLDDT